MTGTQPYAKDAPINLIYVVDYSKTGKRLRRRDKSFALLTWDL
jgi:hypothetical protein